MVAGKLIRRIKVGLDRQRYPVDIFPGCFDSNKCIYFHIPKAAGTSISMGLFGYQVGHIRYTELYHSNPHKTATYFKFGFVRNPWDRLVSAYTFVKKGGMNANDEKFNIDVLTRYGDFEDFVKGMDDNDEILSYVHFTPQHKFIQSENGVIKADYIGKVENITKDIKLIEDRLDRTINLPQLNKTTHNSYAKYYNNDTIERVRKIYAKDIELFHYQFGG